MRWMTLLLVGLAVLTGPWGPFDAAAKDGTAAKHVDLRPDFARWRLEQRFQGKRNTCSVFTTVGAIEYALSKKHDKARPLSVEYLNWACNQVIGNKTDDRGQFFHDLLSGFKRFGICHDGEMPYAAKFHPQYEPSERARKSAKKIARLKVKAHWIKRHDGSVGITKPQLEAIKKTLRAGWPVCGGSHHSVLLVGYVNDPALPGGGQFLVRDSGNGRNPPMSYEEARKRLCDLLWYEVDVPKRRK